MTDTVSSLTKSHTLQAFFVLGTSRTVIGANGVEVMPLTVAISHHQAGQDSALTIMVSCQVIGKRGKPIDDYTLVRYTHPDQMPQWLADIVRPHLP